MHEISNLDRIIRRHLISGMVKLGSFICLAAIFLNFVFGIMTVEMNDMYPSICPGDVVIYYRLGEIRRGDAVIYGSDNRPGRVCGMKPDVIDAADDGELLINGYADTSGENKKIFYDTYKADDSIGYPVKVRDKEYFILGDKRDDAQDSRYNGTVNRNNIAGRIFIVVRRRMV